MGLIYKPFAIVLGLLASRVGKRVFNSVWARVDAGDGVPTGKTEGATWSRLLAAAALQGVILKVTRVLFDRYAATGVRYLTGWWPGEKQRP